LNYKKNKGKKSENFEVITDYPVKFKDIGGYDLIKSELKQCVDILKNYTKYQKYNVRIPRGVILEGPPGTGKTLIAKGLAGEAKTGFISVSGPSFQEKYVGVGASRIRELFQLAEKNIPCIIFIDEIDALGKKRSSDGEAATSERDSTLNQLLICLDGFNTKPGVFVIGATNRIDMLDSALLRPGRIDKRIYIGMPDSKTRRSILEIHSRGKPMNPNIELNYLVEITNGLSGSQIENVLNESMLNALRDGREEIQKEDIEMVMNKLMVGWQPNEHEMTDHLVEQIAIHEMGHAVVGLLAKHHSKLKKVVINFSSPKTPGFTQFEENIVNIYTRIISIIISPSSIRTTNSTCIDSKYRTCIITIRNGDTTTITSKSTTNSTCIDSRYRSCIITILYQNIYCTISKT
jgi:cell division protease FtsH